MSVKEFHLYDGKIFADSEEHEFKRPYMSQWIANEIERIQKMDNGVPRKGVPRNETKPLSKRRQLFALALAINPKLKLKSFAELFNYNYVVVRRWNKDEQVLERSNDYIMEFCLDFVGKLNKQISFLAKSEGQLTKKQKKSVFEIKELAYEAHHYNDRFQIIIYNLMGDMAEETGDPTNFWKISIIDMLGGFLDVFDPPKDKATFKKHVINHEKINAAVTSNLFDSLIEEISNGDTGNALNTAKVLKELAETTGKETLILKLGVINKGKREPRLDEK